MRPRTGRVAFLLRGRRIAKPRHLFETPSRGDLPGFVARQLGAVPNRRAWGMTIAGFGMIGGARWRRCKTVVTYA